MKFIHFFDVCRPPASGLMANVLPMKKSILKLFLILFILLGIHNAFAEEYAYVAVHKISSINIKIGLVHSHPFLAEYKKFIEIYSGDVLLKKIELFFDSGGYSWVSLYQNQEGQIITQDFGNFGLVIDPRLNTVIKIGNYRDKRWNYLGRFDFDRTKGKEYRFITAKDDPTEPITRVKGG